MEDYQLADRILEMCQNVDVPPSVDEIVADTECGSVQVIRVLDQYRVTDGVPKDMGPGGGGGWHNG